MVGESGLKNNFVYCKNKIVTPKLLLCYCPGLGMSQVCPGGKEADGPWLVPGCGTWGHGLVGTWFSGDVVQLREQWTQ